jgi:DNA-binding MarR family transcriptional regulator
LIVSDTAARAQKLDGLIRRLLRAMSPAADDPLNDLPLAQLRVVRVLSTGPKAAGDVGQELGLSPSALSQLVQRLCATGLIQKADDAEDRRVKRLSLSKTGARKVQARDHVRLGRAAALLEGLTEKEQEQMLTLIEKLVSGATKGSDPVSVTANLDKGLPI